jgi:hypothetical protein
MIIEATMNNTNRYKIILSIEYNVKLGNKLMIIYA